jgi:hypothetical protein
MILAPVFFSENKKARELYMVFSKNGYKKTREHIPGVLLTMSLRG